MEASTYNTINKIFKQLREKVRFKIHNIWKKNLLGFEPSEKGVPRIEIDVSKIIGNNENTIWMFGMIDRYDREARVYFVMNNRKKNLLKLVCDNVYTVNNSFDENSDNIHYALNTRIYSDSFASYQSGPFEEKGFILHRVNHIIWFGSGLFHTNSIEGL